MKKILLALILISTTVRAQDTIRSTKLDSLIWKKINEYRASIGMPVCTIFEDSLMRQYSNRVATKESLKKENQYGHSDSIGYLCNGECLHRLIMEGTTLAPKIINSIDEEDFEYLATNVVNGWINSPSHQYIISMKEYTISTVTSVIVITRPKKGGLAKIRLDAVYNCLSNREGSTFDGGYDISKLIKKRKK
jgi:hypothetical protein